MNTEKLQHLLSLSRTGTEPGKKYINNENKPRGTLEDFNFWTGRDVLSSVFVFADHFDRGGGRKRCRQVGVGQRAFENVRRRADRADLGRRPLKQHWPRLEDRQPWRRHAGGDFI